MSYATIDRTHWPLRVTFPRPYNTAVDLVDRHVAEGRGERIAYVDDYGPVTYAELGARVDRAGHALRALGVHREERVMLVMLDTVDFVAVFLGAMKIGAVPVPVNTLLQPDDYTYLVADSRARVVVVSDHLLPKLEKAIAASQHLAHVVTAKTPLGGERGHHPHLEHLLEKAWPGLEAADTTADEVAFWLYSSGSTGSPKGAMHLHSHVMWTSALYAQGILGIQEDDVVYSAAKLFFAYGLGNALTFPLSVGATTILTSERVTTPVFARVMTTHQPTIFCGVPTLFASILADESLDPVAIARKLRVSTSAGEALPKHVGERWRARFASDILDGIGSTELLHIFLSNRHGEVRYGTSGRPVPGYDLEIRGEDGQTTRDGEEGLLWVRGPTSAIGYWNQRDKSLSTFHGPWTRTGDRYMRDGDGFYTYAGRSDDMLKVGGIWVSPFEVESALSKHDAVLEAAVVGDLDADELVKPRAFVVLKDASHASTELEAELKAFVKTTLAPYKYPRWIEFVTQLPKTATGKIQRFRLRR
jgi:benzoate-CoA ligase